MNKILIGGIAVALMLLMIGAVSAQEMGARTGMERAVTPVRTVLAVAAAETGLPVRDLARQMVAGLSLADVIEANGGDVQAVIDEAIVQLREQVDTALSSGRITQDQADRLLANLADVVTRSVNGDLLPDRSQRDHVARRASERILVQETAAATGLTPLEVLREVRQGSTLAGIIEAHGGDVEAVVNAAVNAATEQINMAVANGRLEQSQADALLADLSTVYSQAVNGEYGGRATEVLMGVGVLRLAADETGLPVREIVNEMREGQSLADVLTAQGVDVAGFIDRVVSAAHDRAQRAVENGRLTQADADARISQFRELLVERIYLTGAAAFTG